MPPRSNRNARAGLVLLATTGVLWFMSPGDDAGRDPVRGVSAALGTVLPDAVLESPGGGAIPLRRLLGGGPALLVLASPGDGGALWARYTIELRAVRARYPHLRTLIVGSGSRGGQLPGSALVDPDGALLRHLGARAGPVALVVDSASRVLFVDARRPGPVTRGPVGWLLRDLGARLHGPALAGVPSSGFRGSGS
ncbi:MAG TPA: hypothetical protein VFH97_05200 [Gemmatimonadales bacterium]|nr:hypothetical protein [Gemmatimonadales bacterium]